MPRFFSDGNFPTTARRVKNRGPARTRRGFTLLELILSLSLIVVATTLIGFLMQMYSRNFATRADDIRRQQLARALLNMIAEDIRAVVLEQEYDGSALEKQLGGGGSQGSSGGDGGAPTDDSGLASDSMSTGATDSSMAGGDSSATGDLTEVSTALPPGLYGNQFSLMVEVSRLPRQDEYLAQPNSMLEGTLNDIPSDIKTVAYFVQSATTMGVSDEMAVFSAAPDMLAPGGDSSGLVRRALDRGIATYAEEIGDVTRLQQSGDLVAPEVIAVEFSYFDSSLAQWVFEWDSSTQSLPWLVQISLAMQSAEASEEFPFEPGTPISSITLQDRETYGIEIYELVVAIPGANLKAADASAMDTAAGMDSVGL